jgi:hypothetical protein
MIDHTLKVIALTKTEAVTSMTVEDLLETVLPARAFLKNAKLSPMEQRARDRVKKLHDLIQRDFEGQKKKNAQGLLADYIQDEWLSEEDEPSSGFLPPFTIFFPERLDFDEDEMTVHIRSKGIFLDGESRGEALLVNVVRLEDDPEQQKRLLEKPVAAHIVHGINDERVIAKYFADVNGKGVGVNPNLVVMADYTDPFGEITKAVFKDLGLELETRRRQVPTRSDAVMTGLQARTMVAAMVKGVGVVQHGAKAIPCEDLDEGKLKKAAPLWLDRVFSRFEPDSFRDKAMILRATPVTASLGALGKAFYDGDEAQQEEAEVILADDRIDWTVGRHWDGVCGKTSPTSGNFAVGGGKEYAYGTWNALTDPSSGAGEQIRGERAPDPVVVKQQVVTPV